MAAEVKTWPAESLERRAYDAVLNVPVAEDNDRNRLGYHIFLYVKGEYPSIEEAMHVAQARLHCSSDEAKRIISSALAEVPIGGQE